MVCRGKYIENKAEIKKNKKEKQGQTMQIEIKLLSKPLLLCGPKLYHL